MNIKQLTKELEGKKLPKVNFQTNDFEGKILPGICPVITWKNVSTDEIFKDKRVVLFALPGAFTPTCSSKQLPGYDKAFSEFKKLGVDSIVCLSVNDPFVMKAWKDIEKVKNITMLPDGNGEFSKKLGTLIKKNNLGFGDRSWRYSMFVDNGIVKKVFLEAGMSNNCKTDPYEVSDEKTMLDFLKNIK